MEIKQIILVMLGIFGVFLIILAMGDSGILLESGDWSTAGQNLAAFFVYLTAVAFVVWFIKENR